MRCVCHRGCPLRGIRDYKYANYRTGFVMEKTAQWGVGVRVEAAVIQQHVWGGEGGGEGSGDVLRK